MSYVSLQTFAEFYLVESSVMSSIRTQVHVTFGGSGEMILFN